MDFLTNGPQNFRMGIYTYKILALYTSIPQGCVLSPLLYSLSIHLCVPMHNTDTIIKFADNTTIFEEYSNSSISQETLLHLEEIYTSHCLMKALNIIRDPSQSGHSVYFLAIGKKKSIGSLAQAQQKTIHPKSWPVWPIWSPSYTKPNKTFAHENKGC